MTRQLGVLAIIGLFAIAVTSPTNAQKPGGILRSYSIDSPASMSIHEEATVFTVRPMMAVFNNLVMYDQHIKQNTPQAIVPDLAESWSWDEDGTRLTFKLHQGVRWHDGKPFTSATSNAPGTCSKARRARSFASIRVRHGTGTWRR